MSEPRTDPWDLPEDTKAGHTPNHRVVLHCADCEAATPQLDWPDPKALATALYRDYDYTVTPDDIRAAYARLTQQDGTGE